MPNKKLTCEFCHVQSRKDLVAGHIRSKCMKGVASLLLKEWLNGERITPLKQYLDGRPTQDMPIHSEMYEGHLYWFGVEPKMFDEEESWKGYIQNEHNKAAHEAFITECLSLITLRDFVQAERDIHVKSSEYTELLRHHRAYCKEVEDEKKEHLLEMDMKNRIIERLTHELQDMKDTIESPQTIHTLQTQLAQKDSEMRHLRSDVSKLKAQLEKMDGEQEKRINDLYEANRIRRVDSDAIYETLEKKYEALKKENERLQLSVKKEAQKIVDKMEKERKKDKEKAREAKAKLKEEILLAKMRARRKSPKKKKDISSSSESSSDSDSSDSDADA